jgi:hypothetical protein
MGKELEQYLRDLERNGYTIVRTRKSHIKVTAPNGNFTYQAGTPSDWRAMRNFQADVRRAATLPRQIRVAR